MHNMPVVVGNPVSNVTGAGSGNYAHPRSNNAKLTPMQIRSKFGQLGPSKGQFNSPHGFCLGTDEDIIVADTNNHRIQVHKENIKLDTIYNINDMLYIYIYIFIAYSFSNDRFLRRPVHSNFNSVSLVKKRVSCGIQGR